MEQKLLLKIRTQVYFFVSNFYRINSIKMEKFHAGYGKNRREEKLYLGSYELSVDYQKYGKRIGSGQKVFHRGFLIYFRTVA